MTLNRMTIDEPNLSCRASFEGTTLILSLKGTVDDKSRLKLQEVIDALHQEARRMGLRQVVFDMHALEFMNSSGMKVLVGWIREAQKLSGLERYAIRFVVSADSHWQKRSLNAIVGMDDSLVSFQTAL